jgi:hypothetical protein
LRIVCVGSDGAAVKTFGVHEDWLTLIWLTALWSALTQPED